jgi:hypothetical protein
MVAGKFDLVEQMAGHNYGTPGAVSQLTDQVTDFHHSLWVQSRGWFVQQEQVRIAEEGGGYAQALPHSGGALAEFATGRAPVQAYNGQQAVNFVRVRLEAGHALNAAQIVAAG